MDKAAYKAAHRQARKNRLAIRLCEYADSPAWARLHLTLPEARLPQSRPSEVGMLLSMQRERRQRLQDAVARRRAAQQWADQLAAVRSDVEARYDVTAGPMAYYWTRSLMSDVARWVRDGATTDDVALLMMFPRKGD